MEDTLTFTSSPPLSFLVCGLVGSCTPEMGSIKLAPAMPCMLLQGKNNYVLRQIGLFKIVLRHEMHVMTLMYVVGRK